jgi:hypothetical protein
MFAQMGVGVGLGLLSRLFQHPTDHHFKAGNPYTLPSWSFGGYRASGGGVDPGNAYWVGEQGPELWTPPSTGGSIVSHDALASAKQKGGDTYIDARNTDPAAVDQSVRRGMQAAHNSAVRTSFRSYTEYRKRTPEMRA